MSNDKKFVSIRCYQETKKKIEELSRRYGGSITAVTEAVVNTIASQGINPFLEVEDKDKLIKSLQTSMQRGFLSLQKRINEVEGLYFQPTTKTTREIFEVLVDDTASKAQTKPTSSTPLPAENTNTTDKQTIHELTMKIAEKDRLLRLVRDGITTEVQAGGKRTYRLNLTQAEIDEIKKV